MLISPSPSSSVSVSGRDTLIDAGSCRRIRRQFTVTCATTATCWDGQKGCGSKNTWVLHYRVWLEWGIPNRRPRNDRTTAIAVICSERQQTQLEYQTLEVWQLVNYRWIYQYRCWEQNSRAAIQDRREEAPDLWMFLQGKKAHGFIL
jgi:hypothetical protein